MIAAVQLAADGAAGGGWAVAAIGGVTAVSVALIGVFARRDKSAAALPITPERIARIEERVGVQGGRIDSQAARMDQLDGRVDALERRRR